MMGFAKSHLRLRWIFSLSKLQLVWVNKWNGKIMKTALSLFYPALFRIHLDCVIIKKEKKKVKATRRSGSISFFHYSVNNLRFFCPVVYKSWCLTPQAPGPFVPSAAPRLHSLSQAAVTVPLPCQPASLRASRTPACCHIDGALKQRGWQTGWLTSPQMGSLKIPPNIRESCISAINITV